MKVSAIPVGYHSVAAYITVKNSAAAIEFYARAFGATEVFRLEMGPGIIGHAEIKIGDSHVMLSDEFPDHGAISPQTLGGATSHLMVYCEDCDAAFARAIAAGAKPVRAVEDQFYGDRSGQVLDPFGHRWTLSTHIEDVDFEKMKRRMAAMGG